jgi:hypothetical protein
VAIGSPVLFSVVLVKSVVLVASVVDSVVVPVVSESSAVVLVVPSDELMSPLELVLCVVPSWLVPLELAEQCSRSSR